MLMQPPGSGVTPKVLDALVEAQPRPGCSRGQGDNTFAEETVTLLHCLVGSDWPDTFACTATHADSGDIHIFDSGSEISLPRAVAASCALPLVLPVIWICGRRYMDGGTHDPLNAAFARGHDLLIALSCQLPMIHRAAPKTGLFSIWKQCRST
ncbi:hypothetical protein C6Y14_27115 [Streptomyces dioscori]|uniref:PNPLA domain-containing protein n=1 Tax=Streptomyces dioscori TaxID=2109333 RepID=A0A2P8Q293_9ACTN|nr:patatin-like phospholipase family protein [Streptomyces dioscori]PSM40363.1 hypothetical protein C6Y14_27115 [Streptomyces dioscori]